MTYPKMVWLPSWWHEIGPPSMAQVYTSLGVFYLSSDPMEAPQYLRQSIRLYEEMQDPIGLVSSLIHLAEWHATRSHSFEEREEGIALLKQALIHAQTAAYEQGVAEAQLQQGRLEDTLGRRDEAISLISEAIQRYEQLGRRDREGLARLFLASALANQRRLSSY